MKYFFDFLFILIGAGMIFAAIFYDGFARPDTTVMCGIGGFVIVMCKMFYKNY